MNKDLEIKINELKINKQFCLKEIEFSITNNEIVVIVGQNGSGKSSLIKSIIKENNVKNDMVLLQNKDINKISFKELSFLVSYVPQINNLSNEMLVYDYLELSRSMYANFLGFLNNKEKAKILEVAKQLNIENLLYQKFEALSGGQRQKIVVASCLVQNTPIIIMDEPLTYLDINNQIEMVKLIKELKNQFQKTIIIVLHELELAFNLADKVLLLNNGKQIMFDIPDKVFSKNNLKKYFNVDACFKKIDGCYKLIY